MQVPPATVLVLGAGVAGLAAIQAAKNAGADVRAYDVRPAVKEQVESLGGKFLRVPYEEDGSGAGGYAKEMSDGYKAAEQVWCWRRRQRTSIRCARARSAFAHDPLACMHACISLAAVSTSRPFACICTCSAWRRRC